MKTKLGMTPAGVARYVVAVGLSVVASGAVAKGSLRRFGARGHTHANMYARTHVVEDRAG